MDHALPATPTRMLPTWLALTVAAAAGAGVELIVAHMAGVREAWDAAWFFGVILPGMFLFSGLLGWASPRRPSWPGLALAAGWFGAMWIRNPAGSLWAVGLGFAAGLGFLFMIASVVGAAIRLRRWHPAG